MDRMNGHDVNQELLTFCINRAEKEVVNTRELFIKSCTDMARNLTEAAQRAKDGHYVSETVMTSSLVQDIPKFAQQYRAASENAAMLRQLKEPE